MQRMMETSRERRGLDVCVANCVLRLLKNSATVCTG
jgi:hypothetical protein